SRSPVPTINTTNDDPPKLMNGSGQPVGGMTAVITAIFRSAFMAIQMVIPAASSAPKWSTDRLAIWIPRITSAIYRPTTSAAPITDYREIDIGARCGQITEFLLALPHPHPHQTTVIKRDDCLLDVIVRLGYIRHARNIRTQTALCVTRPKGGHINESNNAHNC